MIWQDYKEKLPKEYAEKDLAVIEQAFDFASEIHEEEKRLTGEKYIYHPAEVSLNVAKLKLGASSVATALLHDTYETDNTVLKKIRKKFGSEISFLVDGLSKVDKVEYQGIERSAESTRKMFMAMAQDIRVVIIKLHDRLHNLKTLHVYSEEKQKRIAMETLEIYAPVADRLGMGDLKLQLEDSAFEYAYPKEYAFIVHETKEKVSERQKYLIKKVIPTIERELKRTNIKTIEIKYRAKHYYSLWKKLLRYNMDWFSIYDLLAVRIIVNSLEDCYITLGILHKLWKPLPGRIKDYISLPKQNGYKSLHTTVFCIDNKITEFQIRTEEMHKEAESGIAAHWIYKTGDKDLQKDLKKFEWIKQLQDWQKRLHKETKSKDFLEFLKIDFFKDRVFVLTPRGDIIDLPEGATPLDFAYHIHTDVGNSIIGAKVNHHIVPLSYKLISGDMVEVSSQKNKKPSLKSLEHATTSIARNHIKSSLKKQGLISGIENTPRPLRCDLSIITINKADLIKEIVAVLSSFRIKIRSILPKESGSNYLEFYVSFTPRNKNQVERVVTRLKTIKGVEEIIPNLKN
ncbi:RelA/SpoT family protein [Patescibacteria group bacterium]